ncbi:hypothetical protein AYM40_05740 [Paraburkholderia phytofirmans OLGA172]|uniref:HEPN AbiU2-like domain-containing protein n=1 Tax=Paraburkholderia phytofirmans OLGA172 TaxID=1417228 RepID=A0A160FI74_9BURK|nr:hypothetical protein [Paraburkholderia phytofirmans]ANB71930.1 hypothetical protein AYM40_05740 [Paraburkholderia phytofirmans OLGA172]
MSDEDPKITALKEKVKAAEQEIGMAVMFHETWKPTAYEEELHKRMGESFATQAFLIVRMSLRRETLLALMRIWDSDKKAVGVQSVVRTLRDQQFFDALIASRTDHLEGYLRLTLEEHLRGTLGEQLAKVGALVDKYTKGGAGFDAFRKLLILRNGQLAHRQASPAKAGGFDATDEEIESFYLDNLEIVSLLLSIVLAHAFDLNEAADVYRHYAKFFWAAALGERTEGHPDYRPPA